MRRMRRMGNIADCQKTCQAKSFGGKKSVKGNRQGVLSRSITPAAAELQNHASKFILQFQKQLGEKALEGLF